MKICVVGNSHVACLKEAWDQLSEFSEHSIDFYAARGNALRHLGVEPNRLFPKNRALEEAFEFTSNGRSSIIPDLYDVFLVYGLGLNTIFVDEDSFTSSVVEAAISDYVSRSISFGVIEKVRSVSERPIYVGHNPLPGAGEVVDNKVSSFYSRGVDQVKLFLERRSGATLLCQPSHTIVNSSFTNPCFVVGSKRLAVGKGNDQEFHDVEDSRHMNAKFGDAWLSAFFDSIS